MATKFSLSTDHLKVLLFAAATLVKNLPTLKMQEDLQFKEIEPDLKRVVRLVGNRWKALSRKPSAGPTRVQLEHLQYIDSRGAGEAMGIPETEAYNQGSTLSALEALGLVERGVYTESVAWPSSSYTETQQHIIRRVRLTDAGRRLIAVEREKEVRAKLGMARCDEQTEGKHLFTAGSTCDRCGIRRSRVDDNIDRNGCVATQPDSVIRSEGVADD